jgi:hypothetical protein
VFTLISLAALAQSPALPPGLSIAPMAAQPAASRWVVAETVSKRFPDAETPGPTFEANALVVVLVQEADRVRVQKGDQVGWVPKSALTDQAPPPPTLPALELPKAP